MLTAERLRELLDYDPATGEFKWRMRAGHRPAGSPAGTKMGDGYLRIRCDGDRYAAHRLAWLYVHGRWPVADIDHINRDRIDNRLVNLREASRTENQRNTALPLRNKSGYKGVDRKGGRWRARIRIGDGSQLHIGAFDTAEAAGAAYAEAAKSYHGAFARLK